jgi:D-lactate dehydrogenase (cytochrome)
MAHSSRPGHRIAARPADATALPRIDDDPAAVSSFLSDAAHVPGGFASGVTFPRTEAEAAALVASAARVLPIGAQSSLTGGATPRGGLILSTRALTAIETRGNAVTAGAGVPLSRLQQELAAGRRYYPPVPTYDGAFVGGSISTNAAGAATFKYGSTRPWVEALTIVLADGSVLDLHRGEVTASSENRFEIALPSGRTIEVPVPVYRMPDVVKLSAGYYARPGMDLIDLFIGSEGTLGVIVSAVLRVVARPRRCVALVSCSGDAQAVQVTAALRGEARRAWQGQGPLDVAAIEYMDYRSLCAASDEAFARAAVTRPVAGSVVLLIQLDIPGDEDAALTRLQSVLDACGVGADAALAPPGDERGAQRLFELREAVPAGVNALVARAKQQVHPDIEKTAGDMVVPFDRMLEALAIYREGFERRGLDYAIWGHISDGNLHTNVVPHSLDDVIRGREALLEMAQRVIAIGGAPLAEHGVGRSAMKQQLLRELYGAEGIDQMRRVKRALDPEWKLSPGVLFPREA